MSDNPWSREYAESGAPPPEAPAPEAMAAGKRRRTPPGMRDEPFDDQPSSPSGRGKRLSIAGAIVAVVCLVAAVLWIFSRPDDSLDETIEAADATLATITPADISDPTTIDGTVATTQPFPSFPSTTPGTASTDDVSITPIPPPITAAPITLPEFEVVEVDLPGELVAYDLAAAAAANVRADQSMRTFYTVDGDLDLIGDTPPGEPDLRATAISDTARDRDSLKIEFGTSTSALVVDRSTQSVFATNTAEGAPTVQWSQRTLEDILEGTGASSVPELFDSLVTGPITPTMLASAQVTPTAELVRMAGGAFARRYEVLVATDDLQPIGGLLLANLSESAIADGSAPDAIRFHVYVTDQPALALVVTRFELDGEARLFTQYFDRIPANVSIDLPPEEQIISESTTP